jgi:hypothetical protein
VEVAEILDRWLVSDHRHFKLRGDDGYICIVCHELSEQTFFDRTERRLSAEVCYQGRDFRLSPTNPTPSPVSLGK